jgi:signal transduction histidine kinase
MLSPGFAKFLAVALGALVFAMDCGLQGRVDAPIFYLAAVLVLAWTGSARWLWCGAIVLAVLTVAEPALIKAWFDHGGLGWANGVDRTITATMLLVTASFAHYDVRLRTRLLAGERRIAELDSREHAEQALGETLQRARTEFDKAERVSLVREMTGLIEHELKQPLSAINMHTFTGLRALEGPNVSTVRQSITQIEAAVRQCTNILNRIRAMAPPQEPVYAPLSLEALIGESISLLDSEAQLQGVTLSSELARGTPQVEADRLQILIVLVSLALNAMQAMEQAKSRDRKITIRTSMPEPGQVCCAVEDSGPGIAPEQIDTLLRSFFTPNRDGLGPAICRAIVHHHGGTLAADNASAHGGARFYFMLQADAHAG